MGDTHRRGRGEKVGNGVVKREIVRFLFSRKDGRATESEVREHLLERYAVRDRATIRNQHLGYLRKKGRIEVQHDPGKENVWSVVDDPSIADYIFAEFAGDDLADVYRSPFVRDSVVEWYFERREERRGGIPPETMEEARDIFAHRTWEQEYLLGEVIRLQEDAVELSPSLFAGATNGFEEASVVASLLMSAGSHDPTADLNWSPQGTSLGFVIAHLLVDFERYGPLRHDIYAFMLRPDLHGVMASLFPPETIRMIFACLEYLAGRRMDESGEMYGEHRIDFEPVAIPPPPSDWVGA